MPYFGLGWENALLLCCQRNGDAASKASGSPAARTPGGSSGGSGVAVAHGNGNEASNASGIDDAYA